MKEFIIEWCRNMIIAIAILLYVAIFISGTYLLDDGTLKGFIYVGLWAALFVAIAIVTRTIYNIEKKK